MTRPRAASTASQAREAPARIEDYALLGNTRTAALVSRRGSIDWFCAPRFDSPSAFAALLGTPDHGHWSLSTATPARRIVRRYRPGTLVLETEMHVAGGAVRVIDCMPLAQGRTDIVRIVEGMRGEVSMRLDLVIRFGYGAVVPWVRQQGHTLIATGGPDTLELRGPIAVHGEGFATRGAFTVQAGQRLPFVLTWSRSHEARPLALDAEAALEDTERWWRDWSDLCHYDGEHADVVRDSLVVLKALTYAPTGGLVAAPTTSLPECIGKPRNWDYRFCWLRDATFTLYALLVAGYRDEAQAWREWLLRAAAGRPQDLQVLYGVEGERIRGEATLPWLPGYRGSSPVRIGNAAASQVQLDVYGEVIDALSVARSAGLADDGDAWSFQRALLDYLESQWSTPDSGIWEMRGPRQHFTHSKMMAWVAMDRAIRTATTHRLDGPIARWRKVRAAIHADICRQGYDAGQRSFVQRYGAPDLDASLLLMPIVGFLPPGDARVRGTIDAIMRTLTVDGLVMRYRTEAAPDGLPPGEGVFLPCSFWLADALALTGRRREARALYARLVALRNDVGLLAEEYDPHARAFLGNFPQALSHVALVNTGRNVAAGGGPSEHRSGGSTDRPPDGATASSHRRHAPHARPGALASKVVPARLDSARERAAAAKHKRRR